MSKHIKNFLKATGFTALLIAVLYFLTVLFTPTWLEWNNNNTMKEFYREPDNSIQVAFLGTSQMVSGISPITLYDNFGICAYNMGTQRQPIFSSYVWLQEIKRKHPDSLKVAVLDISYIFFNEDAFTELEYMDERALAHMELSPVKIGALKELSERYESFNYLENLIPLLRYHSRWNGINRNDFKDLKDTNNLLYTRGQQISYNMASTTLTSDGLLLPRWDLMDDTDDLEESDAAFIKEIGEDNLNTLRNIIYFCKKNNIELILTKLPKSWSNLRHNLVLYIADQYDVPYIDFNDALIYDEVGLYAPFDFMDFHHPNTRGGMKITNFMGRYLKEHYELEDVRNNSFYDFMKKQSEKYEIITDDVQISGITNLSDYLRAIDKDRYTVFVTTAGDFTSCMTAEIREQMKSLGFTRFSSLAYNEPYAAVRSNGEVLAEISSCSKKTRLFIDGSFDNTQFHVADLYSLTLDKNNNVLNTQDGKDPILLNGPGYFSIKSESKSGGGTTSVMINGVEYSDNRRGLNFVVYDNISRFIIDSATFDLRYVTERRSDLDPVEAYNKRYEKARKKGEERRAALEAENAAAAS